MVCYSVRSDMKKGLGFCFFLFLFFWWVVAIPKHVVSESLIPEQMTTQQADIGANQTFPHPCTATDWCRKNTKQKSNRSATTILLLLQKATSLLFAILYWASFWVCEWEIYVSEHHTGNEYLRDCKVGKSFAWVQELLVISVPRVWWMDRERLILQKKEEKNKECGGPSCAVAII